MTIDTEINLPPLPGALVDVETEARAYARAAVEADRADHLRDAAKMVPSDDEILALAEDARVWVPMGSGPEKERSLQALRSLIMTALSRYSSGQPAAVRCNHCGWHGADADLVRDIAADEPEDGAADVCPQCKRIGDLQDIGQPAASAEPIYAFRRKGQDEFVTCGPERFAELQAKPHLFEARIFYAAPLAQEPVAWVRIDEIQKLPFMLHARKERPEAIGNWVPVYAAPVAAQAQQDDEEDRYSLLEQEHLGDPIRKTGIYSDAAQAQPAMPPLTEAMRAVLRNEHCVYDSEDALYAALCNAAGSGPSDQDREDDEALADTQRAIIEAAERRGYERAIAECAQVARAAKGADHG